MTTHITQEWLDWFARLAKHNADSLALLSCFVVANGKKEPAVALVEIEWRGEEYAVTPIMVSVTPSMVLVDHDGVTCT